jgi:DNA-binding NarL/FixJ family response regulator
MVTISLLLVDDMPAFRAGVRRALEEAGDLLILGEERSASAALEHAQAQRPALVLLDTWLRDLRTLDALRRFIDACPAKVIAMAHCPLAGQMALAQGARGVWGKRAGTDLLLQAVRAVARGEVWVDAQTLALVTAEALEHKRRQEQERQLTGREREVLALVGQGEDNHQIARLLFTSSQTVKTHVHHIMDKLVIHDRDKLRAYVAECTLRSALLDGCLRALSVPDLHDSPAPAAA